MVMTLDQLVETANADLCPQTDLSPREWLEKALYYTDLARLAERSGKKEDMFVSYTRAITAYFNCKSHPGFKEAAKDTRWAARVNDYKDTYSALMKKAKDVKESLKLRDESIRKTSSAALTPNASGSSAGEGGGSGGGAPGASVDHHSGGTIADRMKALGGQGMDVGSSSKRFSRDLGHPAMGSRPNSGGGAAVGSPVGMSVTGGAGNFGPARYANQLPPNSGRMAGYGSASTMANGAGALNGSGGGTGTSGLLSAHEPHHRTDQRGDRATSHEAQASRNLTEDLPRSMTTMTLHEPSGQQSPRSSAQSPSVLTDLPSAPQEPPSSSTSTTQHQQPPPFPNPQTRPPRPLPKPDLHANISRSNTANSSFSASPTTSLTQSPRSCDLSSSLRNSSPLPPAPDDRDLSSSPYHRPTGAQQLPSSTIDSSSLLNSFSSHDSTPYNSTLGYNRSPLPMRPSAPPLPPPGSSGVAGGVAQGYTPDADLLQFESAFPSLSEFGKQFESVDHEPNPTSSKTVEQELPAIVDETEDHNDRLKLPSVPTTRPGLPPPPSRPDDLMSSDIDSRLPSPPIPDFGDLKRPASTPMLTETDMLSSPPLPSAPTTQPMPQPPRTDQPPSSSSHPLPPPPPPPPPTSQPSLPPPPSTALRSLSPSIPSSSPRQQRSLSPMAFPVPKPSIPPGGVPEHGSKPDFPISNSVLPDTLRGYFLNLNVDMLFLDVRREEEYKRGYVGQEYEARGAKVNVVWIDPTVVMREGLTSTKLEDSLSLSPDKQRKMFQNRHKFDLVIMYDSRSTTFPRREAPPTPISRLSEIILEKEFTKPLPRFPVLLVGGYEGWVDFIKKRQARHSAAHSMNASGRNNNNHNYNPTKLNGGIPRTESKFDVKRRDMPVYQSASFAKDITDKLNYGLPQSMTGDNAYISRPPGPPGVTIQRQGSSNSVSYSNNSPSIAPPPPAAPIHPGPGARRRSDYVEAHNQTYSGYTTSPPRSHQQSSSIDYPQTYALAQVPKLPPVAAQHGLERQDLRPTVMRSGSTRFDVEGGPKYWVDAKLGLTGLKNLGNTCYMNSTIQCLSATLPFARYFLDGSYKRDINFTNTLGTKGNLANAFAELLKALWEESYTFLSPITFRKNIIAFKSDFAGSEQHDSQEFLSFVMDGLHEDLNRIKEKPAPIEMTPEREYRLETLPPAQASDLEWKIYKQRNDSFIVDLFQGQYMNRLECLTCGKTSTVYDSFQWLTLDLPASKNKVVLPELFDRWVSPEILDGDEKWHCPRCKVNRRASKTLTLVRLPPVLLIQLKRFIPVNNGRFWNKSDTPVIFPLKNLDLTRYVPARKPMGNEDLNDPRSQIGPFKYDLYGVSNHMGTLSSGHYTAYVRSADKWMFCEDSKIQTATEHDVVSRPAYILFYKRVRA